MRKIKNGSKCESCGNEKFHHHSHRPLFFAKVLFVDFSTRSFDVVVLLYSKRLGTCCLRGLIEQALTSSTWILRHEKSIDLEVILHVVLTIITATRVVQSYRALNGISLHHSELFLQFAYVVPIEMRTRIMRLSIRIAMQLWSFYQRKCTISQDSDSKFPLFVLTISQK